MSPIQFREYDFSSRKQNKCSFLCTFVLVCVCDGCDFEPAGRLVLAAGCPDCLNKEKGGHRKSTGT